MHSITILLSMITSTFSDNHITLYQLPLMDTFIYVMYISGDHAHSFISRYNQIVYDVFNRLHLNVFFIGEHNNCAKYI